MKNPFLAHPHEIGETYVEHLKFALKVSIQLLQAGLALFIHSVFPFLFKKTASNTIFSLNKKLQAKLNNSAAL